MRASPAALVLAAASMSLWTPRVDAQTNVGQILDGGATKLSAAEFRQEIVGRFVVGSIRSGKDATQEVVYLEGGTIRGSGLSAAGVGIGSSYPVDGTWKFDESDRVCESTRITTGTGAGLVLAPRCQVWFKLSDRYYVADSETDRSARVIVRSIKKQ